MWTGRAGGLTLRFAGRSVVLYTKYSLSVSKAKYLADAAELRLHLIDAETDFTAFDETPDLEAVSQKMMVGQSWRTLDRTLANADVTTKPCQNNSTRGSP